MRTMKLRYSPTSPYVRKVMITAYECGLADQLVLEPTDAWAPDTDLVAENPLSKVPTMVLEDGMKLYDSPVICEYLDSLDGGHGLFPGDKHRWRELKIQALCDGIMDAAVLRRLEMNRKPEHRSDDWVLRQAKVMQRGVDALDVMATDGRLRESMTIGTISALCALGYLDLRFSHEDWRRERPALERWFVRMSDRDSFRNTVPPAGK